MSKEPAAYGSWPSPVTADLLTAANVGLSEPQLVGDTIYWLESRPLERGRTAIVRLDADGRKADVLPAPLNVRSRVNEYGGGSYCVGNDTVYFVLFDDQRIYALNVNGDESMVPVPLTPEGPWHFGDLVLDSRRRRLLAVCEDHSQGHREAETYLAAISLDGDGSQPPGKLLSGNDFYSSAAISPDGGQMVWLTWNHPNMPWDGCECWVGEFDDQGNVVDRKQVAGGQRESIVQPQWSPDGNLYLISDRSNWWNLYRHENGQLQPVHGDSAEFAGPQWVFGLSSYAFADANTLVAAYTRGGIWRLCTLDLASGSKEDLPDQFADLAYVRANDHQAVFVGASGRGFPELHRFHPRQSRIETVAQSGTVPVSGDYIARAEPVEFPLTHGTVSENKGYAFFYPPTNEQFQGEPGSKPPLLVLCHGGPTAATKSALNLKIQFWTSRGFAVADVNYGGSTGYGRQYRERLNGQWGVVDVQDAVDCVRHLVAAGRVDGHKVAIRGSSAGGYTVLAALTFHDVFRAGASLYGIGDLEALASDTHKFESRYLDNLVGPYPEQKALYRERSPIHHVEQLNCPVIFLQGLQDKVVPPSQAEAMVAALDEKNIPVAYVTFPDEAHGFRQAPAIRRALEAELYFYSRVFGFELKESIEPVGIRNEQQLGRL